LPRRVAPGRRDDSKECVFVIREAESSHRTKSSISRTRRVGKRRGLGTAAELTPDHVCTSTGRRLLTTTDHRLWTERSFGGEVLWPAHVDPAHITIYSPQHKRCC
jgi:hypothetical protein